MSRQEKKPSKLVTTSGVKVPRYFPGKAPEAGIDLSASESSDEEVEELPERQDNYISKNRKQSHEDKLADFGESSSESDSDIDARNLYLERMRARQQASSDDNSDNDNDSDSDSDSDSSQESDESTKRRAVLRKKLLERKADKDGSDNRSYTGSEDESSGSGSSESSNSEESSSEDDYAPRSIMKPVFVPKSQRKAQNIKQTERAMGNNNNRNILSGDGDKVAEEDEYERSKKERREESVRIAAEQAQIDAKEPEIKDNDYTNVDDTDNIDPQAEIEAWRKRELFRIKRDKEEREAADLEEEERERRQNMTEEEKYKEDMKRVRKQKEEKIHKRMQEKTQKVSVGAFKTKHYHKGAFFQDTN